MAIDIAHYSKRIPNMQAIDCNSNLCVVNPALNVFFHFQLVTFCRAPFVWANWINQGTNTDWWAFSLRISVELCPGPQTLTLFDFEPEREECRTSSWDCVPIDHHLVSNSEKLAMKSIGVDDRWRTFEDTKSWFTSIKLHFHVFFS